MPTGPQPELIPRVARSYAGDHPLEDPLISPVYAELAGLPPMLIQTGGAEIFLSENQQLFARPRGRGRRGAPGGAGDDPRLPGIRGPGPARPRGDRPPRAFLSARLSA
ncbi:MAG: alpha/beta hydrolase fold domain-containing protein [Myxococcales bacterium]|nr:alpha/beta hydrolase fold domain-containing protein [Myxococcales bacterium]